MHTPHLQVEFDLGDQTATSLRATWERHESTLPAEARDWPRAAAYVRVATSDDTALAGQLEQVLRSSTQAGLRVPLDLVFAEVAGGFKREGRPSLRRLLAMAGTGAFEAVVVTDPSRLSRNPQQAFSVLKALLSSGVDVAWSWVPSLRKNLAVYDAMEFVAHRVSGGRFREPESWGASRARRRAAD